MQYTSVAVFCGSKNGNDPLFLQHAKELGELIAHHHIRLIYGGGGVGLMGAIADTVMLHGGTVTGVIPEVLVTRERQHHNITELKVVTDMHVRKKMMYELCDAAIILPGGNGTLDELFEMITWNTLKIHEKKIILLNSAGYYDHLITHINVMQQQGFLYEDWEERIFIFNDPASIFASLASDKN